MQLPSTKIASKVMNPLIVNLIVTLIVGFISNSPLVNNPWLSFLADATTASALITLLAFLVGYQTEETAFRNNPPSDQ